MALIDEARKLYDSGLNVLPADRAGKRPLGTWKQWTKARPKFDEVFRPGLKFDAICVVCGATSGGLEIIDFDQAGLKFQEFANFLGNRLDGFPIERTQSGGKHLGFRSDCCGRNQKLASNASGVTIETRGEGGICLIAPSDGYVLERGDWSSIPTLTSEERNFFLTAAKRLNEINEDKTSKFDRNGQKTAEYDQNKALKRDFFTFQGESASEYYKRTEAGKDALRRHGWEYLRDDTKWEQWKRPGQPIADKPGASWSKEDGFFHVFSSNAAPFEPGRSYSHLQVVALLDYGGDVSAASKAVPRSIIRPAKNAIVELVDPFELDDDAELVAPVPQTEKRTAPRSIPFPSELFNVGGLLGEIQDMMNALAIRPQPEGAFLGALACVSYLAGRSIALNYNGTLVTPNLYALFLAPTGMGKEAIRRVASEIARTYAPKEPAPESFASVQALQNFVARVRKILWLHDEFGRDLAVMNGEKNNANVSSVITESLKLYSNASNQGYLPKLVSQEAKGSKKVAPVDRPSLTIFATGNPAEYYEATSETLLKNGYVARFTTVLGRKYSEKKALSFEEATSVAPFSLSPRFQGRIAAWRDMEKNQADEKPVFIPFTRAAFEVVRDFDVAIEKQIRLESETGETSAGARARYFEKVWKYALLFAASQYGAGNLEMVVDEDCARYATLLVDYESRVFSATADRFAANAETRFALDVREWAAALGGSFTKTEFTRKFQRHNPRERNDVLETLLEADYLRQDEKARRFYLQ